MATKEDGIESFEVDDLDLQYALDPDSRNRRRPTKNQQIYGIFAGDEDSDEEEDRGKKKSNYSTRVNFVSGEVKSTETTLDEDSQTSSVGTKRKPLRKRDDKPQLFAGMRGMGIGAGDASASLSANWTKYTKGDVLMKMMQGMGYVPGQGLGANKQGIVEPIQAAVRPGRAAVGAYGKETQGPRFGETAAEAQKREREAIDGVDDGEQTGAPVKGMWKKTKGNAPRTRYKTVDEVIEEGGILKKRLDITSSSTKVIDMTGREQKVYTGYDAFTSKAHRTEEPIVERRVFDIPELDHNLRMLVDLTEEEIIRADRQLRQLREQNAAVSRQVEETRNRTCDGRRQREQTMRLLELLESYEKNPDADLQSCEVLFHQLRADFPEEYRLFELHTLASATVIPMVKNYFSNWNPLDEKQMNYGVELLETWRDILYDDSRPFFVNQMPPYDRLIWEAWMPVIRRCARIWSPRNDGEAMLHVLEIWLSHLPPWISEHLLEHVIVARIMEQVEAWNPLTDTVPIHIWLHPWLPVLGDRLLPVYSPIRQKLAKALNKWNPRDRSAKLILLPWKDVFTGGTMQSFLAQNIVPKLEQALNEMIIDPSTNQQLEEWNAVMQWLDMINPMVIAQLLDRCFFPKWYETLCIWLDSRRAIFHEVATWYSEWRDRLPEAIRQLQSVRDQLTRALHAMDQARRGFKVTQHLEPRPIASPIIAPPPPSSISTATHLSFKEILEQKAHSHGIVFVPQPNKYREGHQVFWFGNISIYVDRCVLFGFDVLTGQWAPISLEHLMSIC